MRRSICFAANFAALDRDLRDPGQIVQRHHVADHEHFRMPGKRQVRVDADSSGTVESRAGLLGESSGQPTGLHSRRPHLCDGGDALMGTIGVPEVDAALVDVDDHGAEHHLDPQLLQRTLRLLA